MTKKNQSKQKNWAKKLTLVLILGACVIGVSIGDAVVFAAVGDYSVVVGSSATTSSTATVQGLTASGASSIARISESR